MHQTPEPYARVPILSYGSARSLARRHHIVQSGLVRWCAAGFVAGVTVLTYSLLHDWGFDGMVAYPVGLAFVTFQIILFAVPAMMVFSASLFARRMSLEHWVALLLAAGGVLAGIVAVNHIETSMHWC